MLRLVALRDEADSVCPRRTNCYVRRNAFCALTRPQSLQPASRISRENRSAAMRFSAASLPLLALPCLVCVVSGGAVTLRPPSAGAFFLAFAPQGLTRRVINVISGVRPSLPVCLRHRTYRGTAPTDEKGHKQTSPMRCGVSSEVQKRLRWF